MSTPPQLSPPRELAKKNELCFPNGSDDNRPARGLHPLKIDPNVSGGDNGLNCTAGATGSRF
ncbi:hypothetical protein [Polaromonas sp. SM01]|uniref:hypothetical protein n=1 Tax=Polaromonas sp. SM01 TaxID=3085630 RepID=UPI002981BC63|nr:hypothetical protein [Polaromonas sp. SM01]MDW5441165.1 hypothetical protein [Polaromonas sp. SM01]